jgi:hypothetical protein
MIQVCACRMSETHNKISEKLPRRIYTTKTDNVTDEQRKISGLMGMSFEVFTAIKIEILVLWVMSPCILIGECQSVGRTHYPRLAPRRLKFNIMNNFVIYVRFEVFTAITMKNAVFWNVAPCRYCVNRRFGGTYRLHL